MVYDSVNASISTAASNTKDFGKKKRVNRTAKLKQSKLDVRREQWLSQVKNRGLGFKEEPKVKLGAVDTHAVDEKDLSMVKLEVSVGGEENHYSDSESPSNSPTNFTGSGGSSSSRSSTSSGGGCFSRSVTDEDDGDHDDNDGNGNGNGNDDDDDDDCLDDWETMADALAADDILKNDNNNEPNVESPVDEPAPKMDSVLTKRTGQEAHRAWRPDDASRPQSLPNLLKQNSFPMQSGLHHGVRFANLTPSSCPICCEDLDMTDSSFLPCPCGYRLCLFCHKRILEENGKCPGCRKQYDQVDKVDQMEHKATPFKLARCYSANPRH
ncbi:uncharacterized protein LOC143589582 [Bidens hawaiensis]|uniref:uncharacterized protein LOC143589582 n=1 Tax=Bidens hawaiensis TaxID=980011 RepID=UPI00404B8A6F